MMQYLIMGIASFVFSFITNSDADLVTHFKLAFWLIYFVWFFKSLVKDAIEEYFEDNKKMIE